MKPKQVKPEWVALLLKEKTPDAIFDLLCFRNYICGQAGAGIPVEESREVFGHIKKLLTNKRKQ